MSPIDLVAASCVGFALVSVGYWLLTTVWLKRWMGSDSFNDARPAIDTPELPPITFFRPLKHGVREIREKLHSFIENVGEHDQIIFGVDPGTEEERISETLKSEFPERDLAVVRCQRTATLNPKISKLLQMAVFAHHEHWVVMDSEYVAAPGWLERFRMEWGRYCWLPFRRNQNHVTGPRCAPDTRHAMARLERSATRRTNKFHVGRCNGVAAARLGGDRWLAPIWR